MSFSSLPNSSRVSARRARLWKLPGLWKSLRDSHNPLENPQTGFPQFRTAPTTSRSEKEREAHSGLQPLLSLRRSLEPRQYLSIRYTERLAEAGIEPSVGSKGDSYDNALAESVIGLYKTEVIRRQGPWRGLEDVEYKTLEWVDWYNTRRLLEPIGYLPPVEHETNYYQEQRLSPQAAGLN